MNLMPRAPKPASSTTTVAGAAAPPVLSVRLRVLAGEDVALGPGKAELLSAIAQTGSIRKAAQVLGISYMHAWLLIQIMNRYFSAPLVHTARGGQKGGGAGLTEEGHAVLALFREMAADAVQAAVPGWERLRQRMQGAGESQRPQTAVALSSGRDDDDLMQESIRNELPGTIKSILSDKVLSEVIVQTAGGEVACVITTHSVKEMKLKAGDKVAAVVKATNVSVRRQK